MLVPFLRGISHSTHNMENFLRPRTDIFLDGVETFRNGLLSITGDLYIKLRTQFVYLETRSVRMRGPQALLQIT